MAEVVKDAILLWIPSSITCVLCMHCAIIFIVVFAALSLWWYLSTLSCIYSCEVILAILLMIASFKVLSIKIFGFKYRVMSYVRIFESVPKVPVKVAENTLILFYLAYLINLFYLSFTHLLYLSEVLHSSDKFCLILKTQCRVLDLSLKA